MTSIASIDRRLAMALVAVFAAAAACAGLVALPPLDRDEARFAQATVQMIESGDFVGIRFQDGERNKKPAGIYWLQAASVAAFSDPDAREIWAYRLPSLAGAVMAAVFTFLAGARAYDVRTGLIAGLLLASAPLTAAEGAIAKTDAVLLGLVAMAQYAFLSLYGAALTGRKPGWAPALLFWCAQGAGILVKGPIAPLVSALTALGLAMGKPRFAWAAAMRPAAGVIVLILMVAPWAVAIGQATEGRFFLEAAGGDMLAKLGGAQEGHAGPPGYHALLLWLLFWPAAALILPGLAQAWRERGDWRARFLLAWAVPAWIFFEAAPTKLPHYVLPLYPAVAVMAAHAAASGVSEGWGRRAGAVLYAGAGLAAAGFIALPPLYFADTPMRVFSFSAAALTVLASAFVAALFWRGRAAKGALAASALAVLYAWALFAGTLPGLTRFAVSPRLSSALEEAGRHPLHDGLAPVAIAGYSEPSAVFLLGTETALTNAQDAAARLVSGAASAAVVEAREEDAFTISLRGAAVMKLAVIDGVNYSKARPVTLTVYVLAP